jgi:DNA repair protein RecO (recombination protein O)
MLYKTRAIVLHHIKYGESSLIVTFYTEQIGRITCMVNGARVKRSKIPTSLFQPLSLLEIDLYYKPNREIQRLKEAWCPLHYTSISISITKSSIALFLAEVLFNALREEEANPSLFTFLFHAFQLLDAKDEGAANFHLWFMLHFTRYLGISVYALPIHEKSLSGIDLQPFRNLSTGAHEALKCMLGSPQGLPGNVLLTHADRALILEAIIRYYSVHLDGFAKLKSYEVLQEVFRQLL